MTAEPGRREQKRQETRLRLAQAARRLFLEQGFDRTKIENIAAAAGVSRRTFFHYFDTKEDVIFSRFDDFERALATAVREVPPQESVLALAQHVVTAMLVFLDPEESREIEQLKRDTPALRVRDQGKHQWLEGTIATALAERTGTAPGELRTKLDAVLIAGVLRVALDGWLEAAEAGVSASEHVRQVVQALEANLTRVG